MSDQRLHDDLGRFWDELVQGGPGRSDHLDPDVVRTVRRLHALGIERPNPAYVRNLRAELMKAKDIPMPLISAGTISLNGNEAPGRAAHLPQAVPTRRHWIVA